MHLDPHLLFGWTRDLALAYAGGLILGAPFALGAVWLTGIELAATACLVVAMTGLLVALRRTAVDVPPSTQSHTGRPNRTEPSTERRVA